MSPSKRPRVAGQDERKKRVVPPPAHPRADLSQQSVDDTTDAIKQLRSGRRKRTSEVLDPFDLVSFNCKMTVVTRRLTRMYAARQERDLQDVVAHALTEYLERRGVEIPQTREEYERMVADGRL